MLLYSHTVRMYQLPGEEEEESTYLPYCHNVSLSLQLCEEELKYCEHVIFPHAYILFLVILYLSRLGEQCCSVLLVKSGYNNPQPINGLTSITCSTNEVEHLLKTMRPDVATGPDSVSSIMLRNTASTISSPLTAIFNQSLATGSVPSDWKRSNITPVYKKDDPALATNYRPIFLSSP